MQTGGIFMAFKMVFFVGKNRAFEEQIVEYEYFNGFALTQKQKSIESLHREIQLKKPRAKILEVSTKSKDAEGVQLSAFNLELDGRPLECVFQSSKVFEGDLQFEELLYEEPVKAKHFIRNVDLKLVGFRYKGEDFPLVPQSLFYDYIYVKALLQSEKDLSYVKRYDVFTDVEFNYKKQINCQARSCAIYAYMLRTDTVDFYMKSLENFMMLYDKKSHQQLSFF